MTRHKQIGFSLVELMVGMVLGIMLIVGAVAIYLASKRSYVEVEQVAALSESARFAQQFVDQSLRLTGFFGEIRADNVASPTVTPPAVVDGCTGDDANAYDPTPFVFAINATSEDVLGCIDDAYVPPSGFVNDVLVIKHVLPRPYTDSPRPHVLAADDGVISEPDDLEDGKIYVMTNNARGEMFVGAGNAPDISDGGAMPNSSAWEYQYEVFYVRLNPDTGIPQLSRKFLEWNGTAIALQTEELAEGVENLRLMFGFDEDGDGAVDRYTNAAGVTDWAQVEAVEVYMLIRSPTNDEQYIDEKTYQVGDETVTPADNFRRLMVFTSVSLRNLKLMSDMP